MNFVATESCGPGALYIALDSGMGSHLFLGLCIEVTALTRDDEITCSS
jgi:hypothetical protein